MPLTLVATVGGVTSNSFCTQADAQAVLDGVPNADAWTGADSATKDQALVYATRMLGALAYLGVKTTVAQALAWPRGSVLDPDYGDTSAAIAGYMVNGSQWGVYLDQNAIPARVVRATAMLALEILRAGPSDVWNTDTDANKAEKSVDVLHTRFVEPGQRRYGLQVYRNVWREIVPLTRAHLPREARRA